MTTPSRRIRRFASGAVLLFATSALGGCFELGNGEDQNCSDDAIEGLIGQRGDLIDQQLEAAEIRDAAEDGSLEEAFWSAQADLLGEKINLVDVALDACDFGPS